MRYTLLLRTLLFAGCVPVTEPLSDPYKAKIVVCIDHNMLPAVGVEFILGDVALFHRCISLHYTPSF